QCVLTGSASGCSLEDMPCYSGNSSTAQRPTVPSPSPTEAATTAPVQFDSGREMEGFFTASPTGAPTAYDHRGSSLAGTASPTPAAPIASADGGVEEAPEETRSPVADNDDTESGAGSGFNSAGTSSGGGDFDGAAEAGDSAACVAWSAATPVPRAVVTLGVALLLAARNAAAR
ncbi:unnamed protein product, partial [Ectocarpus fasciculatus]